MNLNIFLIKILGVFSIYLFLMGIVCGSPATEMYRDTSHILILEKTKNGKLDSIQSGTPLVIYTSEGTKIHGALEYITKDSIYVTTDSQEIAIPKDRITKLRVKNRELWALLGGILFVVGIVMGISGFFFLIGGTLALANSSIFAGYIAAGGFIILAAGGLASLAGNLMKGRIRRFNGNWKIKP